jgi:hypothetical protein
VQEKFEIVLAEKTREATQETALATARQSILSVLDARFGEVPLNGPAKLISRQQGECHPESDESM